jgi:hypothetical protein
VDEWVRWRDDEERFFVLEAEEELAWIVGDFGPLWSRIACSTGHGHDPRTLVNIFASYVILVDRRLRDEAA